MEHLVAKTLAAWREAKRALERLPDNSPDTALIASVYRDLRDLHHRLVWLRQLTAEQRIDSEARHRASVAALNRAVATSTEAPVYGPHKLSLDPASETCRHCGRPAYQTVRGIWFHEREPHS